MQRPIPGTVQVDGREFFYIESEVGEDFHALTGKAIELNGDNELPRSGGVIEEKVRIRISDETVLSGISYKGDVLTWRRILVNFATTDQREYGISDNGILTLSSGQKIELSSCDVSFDD